MFDVLERIENSYNLLLDCVAALRQDMELLMFPLLSGISLAIVLASFALPLSGTDYLPLLSDAGEITQNLWQDPLAWLVLFAFYFLNYLVITFFNSALVACAVIRFNGGDPNVMIGLRFAIHRLPQIIAWSLVASTIGVILRILESERRVGFRIFAAIFGMAWSLMTYFVVPAIVIEKAGPFDAIRKSMVAMRETWGESLIIGITLGPIQFLALLVAAAPFLICQMFDNKTAFWMSLGMTIMLWMLIILVFATLDAIRLAALYLYGSQGKLADSFDEGFLQNAFREKDDE